MFGIESSYSISPRCDTRTELSVCLTLLAACVTAVVFGILAYKEYITPTIAYSAAPVIGVILILTGAAIALIRKERSQEPSAFFFPIDAAESVTITGEANYCSPDKEHPYFYQTICLNLSGNEKKVVVEIESIDMEEQTIEFAFCFNIYKKTYTLQDGVTLEEYTKNIEAFRNKNLLTKRDYLLLTGAEGVDNHSGPALLFVKLREVDSQDEVFTSRVPNSKYTAFSYPNNYRIATHGTSESRSFITFERDEDAEPPRSCAGLHPDVVSRLRAKSWTWYLPGQIASGVYVTQRTDSEKYGFIP